MKSPSYSVVQHTSVFRITGLSGTSSLVTFKEKQLAEDVCRMLHDVFHQGAEAKALEIREVLGAPGIRKV